MNNQKNTFGSKWLFAVWVILFNMILGNSYALDPRSSLSMLNCVTLQAPETMTEPFQERFDWEVKVFDLVDWEGSACEHSLIVELKPMMNRWYLRYQLNTENVLTQDYATLDEWIKNLSRDLYKLMPSLKSKAYHSRPHVDIQPWQLIQTDAVRYYEVSLFTKQFRMPSSFQEIHGLEIGFAKTLGAWQSSALLGFGVAPQGLSNQLAVATEVRVQGGVHLELNIEKSLHPEELNSAFIGTGVALDGVMIDIPNKWRGGGLSVIPELLLTSGWRFFRASDVDYGFSGGIYLPLTQLEFLDVDQKRLISIYPVSIKLKLEVGF